MNGLLLCRTGFDAGLAYRAIGPSTLVGRAQDCPVQVLDDALSRHHARIFTEEGGLVVIEDLGSSLGTEVNGETVQDGEAIPLAHFDVIRLGKVVELVWIELPRVPKTEVLAASLVGPAGERVPLRVGDNTIGSNDSCDLIVPDPSVAARHAVLTLSARGVSVRAEGGQSVKVCGVALSTADLAHDDMLELSPTAEFRIETFAGAGQVESVAEKALAATSPHVDEPLPEVSADDPTVDEPAAETPVADEPAAESLSTAPAEPAVESAATVRIESIEDPAETARSEESVSTQEVPAVEDEPPVPVEDEPPAPVEDEPPAAEPEPESWPTPPPPEEESAILDTGDTAQLSVAELEEARREARDRQQALVEEAALENTDTGRVAEIHSETVDLGTSVRRPKVSLPAGTKPKDFKALRREIAYRISVTVPQGETRVTLLREGRHVLGRSEGCRVVVPHPSVSREHAEIHVGPNGVRIRDLGSSNGTFRKGARVGDLTITAGETLAFGDAQATFEEI